MLGRLFFILVAVFASAVAEEQFIQTKGAELYCKKMGSGSPVIVIHGGVGFLIHDYFLPQMAALAKDHLVVFYDQRGMGRSKSEINPEQINVKTYVEDIEAIRNSLGFKKVSLLGHSWGGFLAMHYAFTHPEAVDKLILVGSMSATSDEMGLFFAEVTKRLEPYHEELEKMESSPQYLAGDPQTIDTQQKIVFQTYMYDPKNINQVNLWKSQQANLNGFKIWEIFKEEVFMQPYDLSDRLAKLQCPTLIVQGVADPMPMVTAEHLKALIPSSQLMKIEKCGHFPFVEQPEEFFKKLDEFLK
jgi:proline iminopeptidase